MVPLTQTFSESFFPTQLPATFPDITFFQSTPPPQKVIPPPPTSSPAPTRPTPPETISASTTVSASVSEISPTALRSTNLCQDCLQPTSTPLNPYRCIKRQIVFPSTPNLLTPSPNQAPGFRLFDFRPKYFKFFH